MASWHVSKCVYRPAIHTRAQLFGGWPTGTQPSPHAVPWVSSWILEGGRSKPLVSWVLSPSLAIQRLEDSGHPETNIKSSRVYIPGSLGNLRIWRNLSVGVSLDGMRLNVCVCVLTWRNRNITKGCMHRSTPGTHKAHQYHRAPQSSLSAPSICICIENIFFSIFVEDRCSTL